MATIVIAEDQAHIRRVLAMWMASHGHTVLETENGCAALALLRENPVDLLISDINMPEMDGLELLREAFAACETLRSALVVTSRCDQDDIVRQINDPRIAIFPKPFSPSRLLRTVDETLRATAAGVGAGLDTETGATACAAEGGRG